MEQLLDGHGSGERLKIRNSRAYTYSLTEDLSEHSAETGYSFNVNTGVITLTSAGKSAILYFKNTGQKPIFITSIGLHLGPSTGGSGTCQLEVLKNPTAGTIVSGASAVAINQNKNAGRANTLQATVYKGAEASTFTDGTQFYLSLLTDATRQYSISTGNIVLLPGNSIGINYTPPAGNTSQQMLVFLSCLEYNLEIDTI